MKAKLTAQFIKAGVEPRKAPYEIVDSELKGFKGTTQRNHDVLLGL